MKAILTLTFLVEKTEVNSQIRRVRGRPSPENQNELALERQDHYLGVDGPRVTTCFGKINLLVAVECSSTSVALSRRLVLLWNILGSDTTVALPP